MTLEDHVTPVQRAIAALFAAWFAVLLTPSAVWAHGAIRDSSPAEGNVVTKPPKEVTLILAEPAGPGSTIHVTDGCGVEVSRGETIEREIYSTGIDGGEPGIWKVRMRSVSAVDGHVVRDEFTFEVDGKKDCSQGSDSEDPITSSRPPIANPEDEGGGVPIVAFAVGTVVVVGLALAIRRPWSRS